MSRSSNRMALLRARHKSGLRYVGIEVRDTEVSELVRRGLIAGADRKDSLAIRDGIHRFLDTYLVKPHGAA